MLDATHTFDREGPDGTVMTADELARATATSLHGEFAHGRGDRTTLTRDVMDRPRCSASGALPPGAAERRRGSLRLRSGVA